MKKINYKNYKILIIDNGSSDNSAEILTQELANMNECIVIKQEHNLGFAGGNNIGINYALKENADYILLLNNDTVVKKDFLDELVSVAESYDDIGIVGGKIYYYDNPSVIWYAGGKINKFNGKTIHIGVNKFDSEKYNLIYETEYITGCMMLLKSEIIRKCGLMKEEYFLYYEETDWNVRIKKMGYKLVYAPKSQIYHKVSAATKKISFASEYYFERNRYYFIMNNFSISNKIYCYFYTKLRLYLKLILFTLRKDKKAVEKINLIINHIKYKVTGEFRL